VAVQLPPLLDSALHRFGHRTGPRQAGTPPGRGSRPVGLSPGWREARVGAGFLRKKATFERETRLRRNGTRFPNEARPGRERQVPGREVRRTRTGNWPIAKRRGSPRAEKEPAVVPNARPTTNGSFAACEMNGRVQLPNEEARRERQTSLGRNGGGLSNRNPLRANREPDTLRSQTKTLVGTGERWLPNQRSTGPRTKPATHKGTERPLHQPHTTGSRRARGVSSRTRHRAPTKDSQARTASQPSPTRESPARSCPS
jgi:hypothetical protein